MAFSSSANPLPTDYFTGYLHLTASGTSISGVASGEEYILIPRDEVTGLTAGEAHLTTGNGSKVLYGLIKAAYTQLQAEAASARPESLTLTEGSISGATATTYRQSITMQALFDISASDIADES